MIHDKKIKESAENLISICKKNKIVMDIFNYKYLQELTKISKLSAVNPKKLHFEIEYQLLEIQKNQPYGYNNPMGIIL